jgi:Uma2 family endonuclease
MARQPELIGRDDLIKCAPTGPDAFLRWGAQRQREEGGFELSRGRVTCDTISASRPHGRVAKHIVLELGRLDGDQNPRRDLSTSTPIFISEVLSPSTASKDFIEKREEYTAIFSLQTHLICSRDEPRARVLPRQGDGSWPTHPTEMAGREATIALGGPSSMAAIFRGIPDAPTVE